MSFEGRVRDAKALVELGIIDTAQASRLVAGLPLPDVHAKGPQHTRAILAFEKTQQERIAHAAEAIRDSLIRELERRRKAHESERAFVLSNRVGSVIEYVGAPPQVVSGGTAARVAYNPERTRIITDDLRKIQYAASVIEEPEPVHVGILDDMAGSLRQLRDVWRDWFITPT